MWEKLHSCTKGFGSLKANDWKGELWQVEEVEEGPIYVSISPLAEKKDIIRSDIA